MPGGAVGGAGGGAFHQPHVLLQLGRQVLPIRNGSGLRGHFASIVKDAEKLEMLLGGALIAENCMFGVLSEPKDPPLQACSALEIALEDEHNRLAGKLKGQRSIAKVDAAIPRGPSVFLPSNPQRIHNDALFQRIMADYYLVFANGYRSAANQEHVQAGFISQIFVPPRMENPQAGDENCVQAGWRALCQCFDVLEFKQSNRASTIEYNDQEDTCVIRSSATYTIQLKLRSIELAFPHVLTNRPLVAALAGSVIVVPSTLSFTIKRDTGLIAHVVERMDFVDPITALLQNREAVSFVMSRTLLSVDGVSCFTSCPVTPILQPITPREAPWRTATNFPAAEKCPSDARAMTMTDIFHV